jgi:hypothetical protein
MVGVIFGDSALEVKLLHFVLEKKKKKIFGDSNSSGSMHAALDK